MDLNTNQTNVLLPEINNEPKKIRRQKNNSPGNVYYKEDIAGLWVFLFNDKGNQQLITQYPITDPAYRVVIKNFIDDNYDKRKK